MATATAASATLAPVKKQEEKFHDNVHEFSNYAATHPQECKEILMALDLLKKNDAKADLLVNWNRISHPGKGFVELSAHLLCRFDTQPSAVHAFVGGLTWILCMAQDIQISDHRLTSYVTSIRHAKSITPACAELLIEKIRNYNSSSHPGQTKRLILAKVFSIKKKESDMAKCSDLAGHGTPIELQVITETGTASTMVLPPPLENHHYPLQWNHECGKWCGGRSESERREWHDTKKCECYCTSPNCWFRECSIAEDKIHADCIILEQLASGNK